MRPGQLLALGAIVLLVAAMAPIFSRQFLRSRRHTNEDASSASASDSEVASDAGSEELNDGATGAWPWDMQAGGEVCRAGRGQVKRYHHKVAKLKDLSASIKDASIDRLDRVLQLRSRIDRFESCFVANSSGIVGPDLLKLLNDQEGPQSLNVAMKDVQSNLLTWVKKKGFLPTKGDCSFNLESLDMKLALEKEDSMTEAQRQLFGPSCDAAAIEEYKSGLDKASKKLVKVTEKFVSRLIEVKAKPESAGSAEVAMVNDLAKTKQGIVDDTPGMRAEYVGGDAGASSEHVKRSLKASAALMEMDADEESDSVSEGNFKALFYGILIMALLPFMAYLFAWVALHIAFSPFK